MIELFGRDAEQALGIDRSPEMLRLARVKLAEAGLDAAELRQGDMYALPLAVRLGRHGDPPPGAPLRPEPGRRGGRGGAAARARRAAADRRFRAARARGIAQPRRPCPARLRRRGDAQISGGGRASRAGSSSISKAASSPSRIWVGERPETRTEGGRMSPGIARHRRGAQAACSRTPPATSRSASNSSRPRRRRWRRRCGSRCRRSRRSARASSRSPTAPAARPASAPTPRSRGSPRETALNAAAHLTCVEASRGEIDEVARAYWEAGVRHIVALRGDPPEPGKRVRSRIPTAMPMPPSWSPG